MSITGSKTLRMWPGASPSSARRDGVLCPRADAEHQLEDIMYDFINGDIDVLVSTTIIETGLDIANANTMIIQDADRSDCPSSISCGEG